jgi:hypothetical protein
MWLSRALRPRNALHIGSLHLRNRASVPSAITCRLNSSSFDSLPEDVMWLPMPTLSPSMESGTITQWTRKEGQDIEQYQVLLKLTTGAICMSHHSEVVACSAADAK